MRNNLSLAQHRRVFMLTRIIMLTLINIMQASQQDGDITVENVTVGVVGDDQPFTVLEGVALQPFVSQLDSDQPAEAPAAEAPADEGAAPMES
jgi:hypothetical protein